VDGPPDTQVPTFPSPRRRGVPYREGKALTELIPPDRRRLKTALLVGCSMIAGAALWVVGGSVASLLRAPGPAAAEATPGYIAGRIGPTVLHGPDHDVELPPRSLAIVHVWLQGCQDCMPAFEAMRRLEDEGGLGVDVPIVNVAYGEADPTWAMRYGVRANLVYDPGGASVLRPLGIGTFTTLVIDHHGTVLHRDRPDRPGYRARIRAAVHDEDPRGEPTSVPLDAASIARVAAAHRPEVKHACWDPIGSDAPRGRKASVTVLATVGINGVVEEASSTGSDPKLAKCVEDQLRGWRFPSRDPGDGAVRVTLPFEFMRE